MTNAAQHQDDSPKSSGTMDFSDPLMRILFYVLPGIVVLSVGLLVQSIGSRPFLRPTEEAQAER